MLGLANEIEKNPPRSTELSGVKNIADLHILVTGADGFIGSHLTQHLLAAGARVKALAWYRPQQDRGWLDEVGEQERLQIVSGDIRDAGSCRSWIQDVDLVFHLAALIGIPYSYEAPESYLSTNIQGTFHLLEACRERATRMMFMSSSEVYGSALAIPITEAHPLQPQSPYSASKIGGEALVRSYHFSYGLPVTIMRVFNTYGPRQSSRAIIPTVITQLLAGNTELQLGDLLPTRDLVYVGDTCKALVALATSEEAIGAVVNVATGTEHSMKEVVDHIQELLGSSARIVSDPKRQRPAQSEVQRLCGDPGLLQSLTGYSPDTPLSDGLRATIAWFLAQGQGPHYKPHQYHV